MAVVASKDIKKYFRSLQKEADKCYKVASEARKNGFDPELDVEIPQAHDLASRVEKQLKDLPLENVADIIREIAKDHDREETSLLVAKKIAKEFNGPKEMALDTAVRTGLAVLTEGILVAPLDGIIGVKIIPSHGGNYAAIYYAGPIRSAGGTGQALSVLIADVVRRELGIGAYKPTDQEVERFKEEIPLYKIVQHLQYLPSEKEIEAIVRNCPISIDGEGTEDVEISGYRDLPRIETNRVRGGPCLVIAEGLCQKGKKIQKHVKKLGIDGWDFIDLFVRSEQMDNGKSNKIEPNSKFIKDILAGRPVYAHPSRKGGFRLRYGRTRSTGLAAISIHPATMYILQETTAVGTQIKIERPGKAGITMPCDSLEGALVILKNGDMLRIQKIEDAKRYNPEIEEIVDLGEILIPVGEFLENNHPLVPGVFDIMWYMAELRNAGIEEPDAFKFPDTKDAFDISRKYDVPLHPTYTYFWNDLSIDQVDLLRDRILNNGHFFGKELYLPDEKEIRKVLIDLGVPHHQSDDNTFTMENGLALLFSLGLRDNKGVISLGKKGDMKAKTTLDYVSSLAGIKLGDKCGTRIGARMARPEKADMRKMNPPVHGLFAVGKAGGPQRLLNKAMKMPPNSLTIDLEVRRCKKCGEDGLLPKCSCGGHRISIERHEEQKIDLYKIMSDAKRRLNMAEIPKVKGVQGMISRNKTVEMPEKGILRAKHEVFVFKDGTCRFDATDAPLTHFKPEEIAVDIETLNQLGYTKDMHGEPIVNTKQLIELRPQDVILPERGGDYFVRVSKFIDELLVKVYGMEPFYNARRRRDLVGCSIIGLSPHTSGGVLSRLIGFTKASVGFAHPFFHAAKRRNCDGDEDCFMLLLDGLLNFSWSFLPEKRGGRMDAPLLLSTILDPNEIDKEAHNIDLMDSYPLELYRAALEYEDPQSIEGILDTVGKRIGSVLQYEHFGFTNDTSDVADAPTVSSYKTLGSMEDKTRVQLDLAKRIRAVDERDVAERLINNHLMPDMIGNLKSFSSQTVRCTKCGKKYRRIPIIGHCYCGHKLILTVHEGSVRKYLEMSKRIAKEFDVSPYVSQRIDNMEKAICSLFQNEKVKECTLMDF